MIVYFFVSQNFWIELNVENENVSNVLGLAKIAVELRKSKVKRENNIESDE